MSWCEECDQSSCILTSEERQQVKDEALSIASRHPGYRAHLLDELAKLGVCLLCGSRDGGRCYCAPCYDKD